MSATNIAAVHAAEEARRAIHAWCIQRILDRRCTASKCAACPALAASRMADEDIDPEAVRTDVRAGIPYTMANLGRRDPRYGGILTDVSALPPGTSFRVCNGGWNGRIVELDDGRKAVMVAGEKPPHKPAVVHPPGSDANILALADVRLPDGADPGKETDT